ncbi:MAG: dihydrolipoyl dehydrogenase [Candidatus Pacebacteria bacterium]|nr:dihydrolipoyl dehydrogenase [Candidatus Paceibacterota bacterium]
MPAQNFDVVIIGGGPGGYVAAIRAAQLGLSTAVVERENLGGICLNWGCIPTKALLKSAEINSLLHHLGDFGFTATNSSFDLDKIVKRSRAVSNRLTTGIKFLMKKNKVTVFDGEAKLAGRAGSQPKLTVSKDGVVTAELVAKNIIIATGARARTLPGMVPDGDKIWSYREAMVPKSMPKSLLVVGSGAIGIEFASFYRQLGAEVTVVEVVERILPAEDAEIAAIAHKDFVKQGMKIITSASVKSLTKNADGVAVVVEQGGKAETHQVERVILAMGIVGNVENLGLEGTKILVEKTHIVVDSMLRTGEPNIYAIGDVAGPPWLAHKASHEGVMAAELCAGHTGLHAMDPLKIPGCTYATPQVASVGLTEARAKAAGREIKVGRFSLMGNGKAVVLGETDGLIKTIFDAKTGELLGAHMVGPEVTEMIQGFVIALNLEATEADLMHTVFPHPTVSESMHESVLDAYGRVIHM